MPQNTETTTQFAIELRKLFPLPSREVFETQAAEMLPFAYFGASGGYGPIRRELLNAITRNDRRAIEAKYYELIADGLADYIENEKCDDPEFSTPLLVAAQELCIYVHENTLYGYAN